MIKIFSGLLMFSLLVFISYSQYNVSGVSLENNNSGKVNHKLSLGLGITTKGMAAGSAAFKLRVFRSFYMGACVDVFGAEVNAGAHTTGMILLSIVPEYQFFMLQDKVGFNVSSGFGFIVSMEPVYCISPGLGLEYKLNKKLSAELDSKYLFTKYKAGSELNGIIVTKLNLNFIF
jgi:hypothetical protein